MGLEALSSYDKANPIMSILLEHASITVIIVVCANRGKIIIPSLCLTSVCIFSAHTMYS